MSIARLGGVVAGALLAVPLLSPIAANAAVQAPAAVAPVSYASDCHYTHWWHGSWHRHLRLVCDDDGYYGGGYGGGYRGGHGDHGDHGNHGGGSWNGGGGKSGGGSWNGGGGKSGGGSWNGGGGKSGGGGWKK